MSPLEDAFAGSMWFLLIVGSWVVGKAFGLFKSIFFVIFSILVVFLLGDLQIVRML